ncbi:hypothetical protein M069_0266 [Bacteroides fragilis str. B1 (UDC16-1)]|nr:hypothetical protein M069_0266 [Bacteroides fragilis str. B1 (UDC16-1)]
MPFMLEADFHPLTVQVGDKHIPVAAPADFRFQYVVQPVLRPVRLLQTVALDILLAASHVQTVFQGKFLADTGAAQPLVPVRNGPAVIAYAVEGDMHVRMLLVEVAGDEEMRVAQSLLLHVLKCYPCHDMVCQAWLVLFGETQGDVSHRLRHLAVHLRLDVEAHCDGVLVFHEQALMSHYLHSLVLVKDVVHHTLEITAVYDFRHHIPILVRSSWILATTTLQSSRSS